MIATRGLDTLTRQLAALPAAVAGALDRAATRGLTVLTEAAQQYPPPLPQQQYVRTYDLQRGWTTPAQLTRSTNLVTARVVNPVDYSGYVQDATQQARIHQGRWPTTEQIEQRHAPRLQQIIEDELRAAVRSIGL